MPVRKQSYFAQRLASEPALAARCEAIVTELRNAASGELKAAERSGQLTGADLAVYINARAEALEPPPPRNKKREPADFAVQPAQGFCRARIILSVPCRSDKSLAEKKTCDFTTRASAQKKDHDGRDCEDAS